MPAATRPSRFRLPTDVRPTDYDLHLEPDLEAGTFRGDVRIGVRLTRPRGDLVLHAAGLAVERAVARAADHEIPARVTVQRDHETVRLRFARPLPAGDAALVLR